MGRDLLAEIQTENDAHHRHQWQPGPMIAGWSSHAPNDEGTPNELIILCPCGAIGRIEVPRKLTRIRPLSERSR